MLKVDATFLKTLHAGEALPLVNMAPARTWSAEKLQIFATKLKAQTAHETPVPST